MTKTKTQIFYQYSWRGGFENFKTYDKAFNFAYKEHLEGNPGTLSKVKTTRTIYRKFKGVKSKEI